MGHSSSSAAPFCTIWRGVGAEKARLDWQGARTQRRYQPTLLNGEPVEVDTTISVIFTLGGG